MCGRVVRVPDSGGQASAVGISACACSSPSARRSWRRAGGGHIPGRGTLKRRSAAPEMGDLARGGQSRHSIKPWGTTEGGMSYGTTAVERTADEPHGGGAAEVL